MNFQNEKVALHLKMRKRVIIRSKQQYSNFPKTIKKTQ